MEAIQAGASDAEGRLRRSTDQLDSIQAIQGFDQGQGATRAARGRCDGVDRSITTAGDDVGTTTGLNPISTWASDQNICIGDCQER